MGESYYTSTQPDLRCKTNSRCEFLKQLNDGKIDESDDKIIMKTNGNDKNYVSPLNDNFIFCPRLCLCGHRIVKQERKENIFQTVRRVCDRNEMRLGHIFL